MLWENVNKTWLIFLQIILLQEKSIIVKHFQLLGWASNQDKPSSPQCILDLLGAVQRWKDECHSSRPAIVQCL